MPLHSGSPMSEHAELRSITCVLGGGGGGGDK